MAYNFANETRKELLDVKKNDRGECIRITAITTKTGEKSYDIRNMYINDQGELAFTAKGIRIKQEHIADVITAIMTDLDAETYNNIIENLDMIAEAEQKRNEDDAEMSAASDSVEQ